MINTKFKALLSKFAPISKVVNKRENYFFVHIPKTAGTSFRSGVEEKFHVVSDYGHHSTTTSKNLQEEIYLKHDPFALKTFLQNNQPYWLFGHVPLQKYVDFVPVLNTVTFVRSPLEQVISHYNHFVSHNDFIGNLEDFIKRPGVLNVQHRLLAFLPSGLIGCLGLTEKYDDSLMMINDHLQTDFSQITTNVNTAKSICTDDIDIELQELILRGNHKDLSLYSEACFIFEQRLQHLKEQKPWVYAVADVTKNKLIQGCAYFANKQDAVILNIHINNKRITQVKAQDFYREYTKVNFPRQRYIGFHHSLPKSVSDKDIIDVYVNETGQKVNYKPLKIPSTT